MTSFAHSQLTDQHFTPPELVEKIQQVMGKIDLDPCTDKIVNERIIKAFLFFESNGLERLAEIAPPTPLKVFCNPPGGKTKGRSNMLIWLEEMHRHWLEGKVEQFFFLFFNREMIGGKPNLDLSYIPRLNFYQRLHYCSHNEITGSIEQGNWQVVGDGNYLICKGRFYWSVFDSNLKVIDQFSSKKEAIAFAGKNYKLWTDRPGHPSTLMYFPPRTNSDWCEKTKFLKDVFGEELGRWVIPQFPTDLGAK